MTYYDLETDARPTGHAEGILNARLAALTLLREGEGAEVAIGHAGATVERWRLLDDGSAYSLAAQGARKGLQ